MGTKEIEAVRAFCVFVRAAGGGKEWLTDATDEQVRTMAVIGETIGKFRRGMEACAIPTPKGPLIVHAGRDVDAAGGRLEASWLTAPMVCDGRGGRLAEMMFHALMEAGGAMPDLGDADAFAPAAEE